MSSVERTFQVTVAEKTQQHPYYGKGSKFGYVIDGIEGKTLELYRGSTYKFDINAKGHPFMLSSDSVGGRGDQGDLFSGGVTPTDSGIIEFTVPSDFPYTFYYVCQSHPYMGERGVLGVSKYIDPILSDFTAADAIRFIRTFGSYIKNRYN